MARNRKINDTRHLRPGARQPPAQHPPPGLPVLHPACCIRCSYHHGHTSQHPSAEGRVRGGGGWQVHVPCHAGVVGCGRWQVVHRGGRCLVHLLVLLLLLATALRGGLRGGQHERRRCGCVALAEVLQHGVHVLKGGVDVVAVLGACAGATVATEV